MQKVYLSRTIENQPGLFTNGFLVISLNKNEFQTLQNNFKYLKKFCKKMKFEAIK